MKEKKISKQTLFLIFTILILGIILRIQFINTPFYHDPDTSYHYSIVNQAVENKHLSSINKLDLCYNENVPSHPVGFYILPYMLVSVGLELYATLIYWILTIIILFFLIKKLFSTKHALITISFVALIWANVQRSFIGMYRGENIIIPLLLLSLYLIFETYINKKANLKISILTGISIALMSLLWNGSAYGIMISNLSIFLLLSYSYYKKKFHHTFFTNFNFLIISQIITVSIITKFITFSGKHDFFMNSFYVKFILLPLLLYNMVLLYSHKKKFEFVKIFSLLIASISLFLFSIKDKIIEFLEFFKVRNTNPLLEVISETQDASFLPFWNEFWIISIFSIFGIIYFFRKFTKEKILLSTFIIVSIILLFFARRYSFLASVPICILASFALVEYMKKSNTFIHKTFNVIALLLVAYSLFLFIFSSYWFIIVLVLYLSALFIFKKYTIKEKTIVLIVLLLFFSTLNTMESSRSSIYSESTIDAIHFMNDKIPKTSCIMSTWDIGSLIQYETGTYTYTSSVGGQNLHRIREQSKYYLSNKDPNFNLENLYIHTDMEMLDIIDEQAKLIGMSNLTYPSIQIALPGGIRVIKKENGDLTFPPGVVQGVNYTYPRKLFGNNTVYNNKKGKGCAIINSQMIFTFIDDLYCDSNLVKMLMLENVTGATLEYSNSGSRIYKVIN